MKVYKSSILPLAVVLGVILVFLVLVSLFVGERTSNENLVKGLLFYAGPMALIIFLVSLTRIKIFDGEVEYSEVGFLKRRSRVKDITEIERGSTYSGLSAFGYSMFIYHTTQDGQQKVITIGENQFSQKTIKSLVSDLVRINPDIKLHEHYQKMVK